MLVVIGGLIDKIKKHVPHSQHVDASCPSDGSPTHVH